MEVYEAKNNHVSDYNSKFVFEFLFPDGSVGTDHLVVIIEDDNICVPLDYFGFIISFRLYN